MSVRVSENINHFNLLTNRLFLLNNMFFFRYCIQWQVILISISLQIECLIKTCLKKESFFLSKNAIWGLRGHTSLQPNRV